MVKPPSPPSRSSTLRELLSSSKRDFVPIRKTFAQQRSDDGAPMSAPLAAIVSRGVPTALDQYLLVHARAAGRPDGDEINYDVTLSARVWTRLLGLADDESGRRTVGRNWAALEELNLVAKRRTGRQNTVTILREDGSGLPYTRPKTKDDPFLKIPYDFWLDGHAEELKLPGMALAVIACSLTDWFPLPFDKGPTWYGIGSSTVERGLRELRRADLIEAKHTWRETPLSETGWTKDMRYRLKPPLGPLGHMAKDAPKELLTDAETASPPSQADSRPATPTAPHASGDKA